VEVYDASGKLIPGKFELKDPATVWVDIKTVPSGTYLLNITEGKPHSISENNKTLKIN
jgi:hypothetical protein